jgi:cyclopropane-fatty-acyl-phospholipid synthase
VLGSIVNDVLGSDVPFRVELPDGEQFGPPDAPATIILRSTDALAHLLWAPGELGLARAYVSGSLDFQGDIWTLLADADRFRTIRIRPQQLVALVKELGIDSLRHRPPLPPEEIAIGGLFGRHSRDRDARSISHHYDVGNDFYRMVLGPSMTYSCAVFGHDDDSLEQAQSNKYELVCRKLGLEPGMRLLDVGCGWGGMAIHAARHHGVEAVGITISREQCAYGQQAAAAAGLAGRVDIRLQDYRDLGGERFDAISSIGMFEHVGLAHLTEYFEILRGLLRDEGRLLNHQIGRPPGANRRFGKERPQIARRSFINRYVFPDGELHQIGDLIGAIERIGFEVRHVETLREHYAKTLRCWVGNLESHWDDAVALTSEGRARVWRLYMAASSVLFAAGRLEVHQVLATKSVGGRSGMPWRPAFDDVGREPAPLTLLSAQPPSTDRQPTAASAALTI